MEKQDYDIMMSAEELEEVFKLWLVEHQKNPEDYINKDVYSSLVSFLLTYSNQNKRGKET